MFALARPELVPLRLRLSEVLTMTSTTFKPLPGQSLDRFTDWLTSTENRLYVGWFGV